MTDKFKNRIRQAQGGSPRRLNAQGGSESRDIEAEPLDHSQEFQPATLSDWCQTFCASASHHPMSEFILKKQVWGWDREGIILAVNAAIQSTGYTHNVSVWFEQTGGQVVVRPDHGLARWMSEVSLLPLCSLAF